MPEAQSGLKRELGVRDLTLFAITCICGPRWIATAAHFGPGSVTLWLLAGLMFLAPLGIAVAVLMDKYPGAGGLYLWAREDFGPWHGFLAFWTYWISIAFTLPSAALIAVGVGVFTLGPSYQHLADSRTYLLIASLAAIWIALGTNMIGLKIGKWTENLGGMATWVLAILLVGVAVTLWNRHGSATEIHILPTFTWQTINFWSVITFALSGLEVAGMMGAEIRSPKQTVPPATWMTSIFSTAFYVVTTIAVLVMLKPASISEIHGLGDAGAAAAVALKAGWIPAVIAVLFTLNMLGAVGGLGSSVSRLPYAAGADKLLPAAFSRVHPRWRTPYISILALALVASFLLLATQLGDTLRAAYQAMISLMVITGFIPYLYIFASAWRAKKRIAAISGQFMTVLTLVCSVAPTDEVHNVWLFEFKLLLGTAAVVATAWFLYRRSQR